MVIGADDGGMTSVAAAEIADAVGTGAATPGNGSVAVVRTNSGEPRYHAMATTSTADSAAVARMRRARGMLGSERTSTKRFPFA